MHQFITLLAEVIPTGVTESTTLADLGPTIFMATLAIAVTTGVITLFVKMKGLVKEGTQEFFESKVGEKLIEENFWTFVKTEGYGIWIKNKIDTHTSGQMEKLLNHMEQLTKSVGMLTDKVEKLVDKLESQSAEMREMERRFSRAEIGRANGKS